MATAEELSVVTARPVHEGEWVVARQHTHRFFTLLVALGAGLAGACSGSPVQPDGPSPAPGDASIPAGTHLSPAVAWHGHDGNRLVAESGSLSLTAPVDVVVSSGVPVWVVGAIFDEEPQWVLVDAAGSAFRISVSFDGESTVEALGAFGRSAPPTVVASPDGLRPLRSGPTDSPLTPPGLSTGVEVAVAADGRLRIGDTHTRDVGALPDARVVFDGSGRALVLSGATDRYPHGVLGDRIEATAVSLVDLATGDVTEVVRVGDGEVIEGTAPIWSDLDADGRREIIVTVSTPAAGSRLVAFSESGEILAQSEPIGRSSRWRHQVAVAPMGPGSEIELVDVLTPHLGGVVEFFRLVDGRLEIVASVGGYTSHFIGSRNLSVPVVADTNGDGRLELIVPSQDRESIGGIIRTEGGAETEWVAGLDGRLSTNLSVVVLPGGRMALAAGRQDGTLRVWLTRGGDGG